MTKAELILALANVPDDMPVTVIKEDFPRDIKEVEILDATRYGDSDHWSVAYFPEVEEEPLVKIAVIS